jgi:fatty-acyl-CoA synthase
MPGMERVDQVFARAAERWPNEPHLILVDGTSIPYAETYRRACRLAGALAKRGVAAGDRIALYAGNSRALYEAFIAAGLLGAIAVPLNVLNTAFENAKVIADAAPRAAIAEFDRLAALPDRVFGDRNIARISVGGAAAGWSEYESTLEDANAVRDSASRAGEAALIIYSSGTTGEPKGIVLSHRGLILNSMAVGEVFSRSHADRFLTLLPSFHLFGYSFDFLACGLVGGRMIVMPQFDPVDALGLVERHRATLLAGVPLMFARMFDPALIEGRDLSSLRLIDVGGGPVPDSLKSRLKERLGIETVESYGLTEISATATVQRPGRPSAAGSSGPSLPGFEVSIRGSDGQPAPTGSAGEIVLRGPTPMLGYWNQPALTAATLRDGWLHTGDLGRMDEDGHVHVLDRIKDMIVSNGRNIYPKEVENALSAHPGVQAVAVIGIPEEMRGERVHACVVRRPGAEVEAEELLSFCREYLAPFKIPRAITFLDAMPTTASGKIRRFKLRELAGLTSPTTK